MAVTSDKSLFQVTNSSFTPSVITLGEEAEQSITIKNISGTKITAMYMQMDLVYPGTGGTKRSNPIYMYGGPSWTKSDITWANNTTQTFTGKFRFTVPNADGYAPNITTRPMGTSTYGIHISIVANEILGMSGGNYDNIYRANYNSSNICSLYVLGERLNPTISVFDVVRVSSDNTKYVEDDEGTTLQYKIKLALGSISSSGFSLTCRYAENADVTSNSTTTTTISLNSTIANALTSEQTKFFSGTFDCANDQSFLLTFGDAYESTSKLIEVSKSFTNVHLSGKETGGVCFGGFSTAEDNSPKLESYYPAYLYGGIAEVGALKNSLAAMGIQYGQTSSVDASKTTFTVTFDRPYSAPPYVYAMPVSVEVANTTDVDRLQVSVKTVSKTQATISAYNDAGTRIFCINWLAIGTPNNDPNAVSTITMPPAAMGSSSSNGCTVSASTTYSSSYPARKAFDFNTSTSWASKASDNNPWIQIEMPYALKNIKVSVYARGDTPIHNPTSGTIYGGNGGSATTAIGSFSGWDGTAKATLLGTVDCSSSTSSTGYNTVKISITKKSGSEGYVAIGYISIEGEKV